VATPGLRTIAAVSALLKVGAERCLKTLLVAGSAGDVVALVLRGDHELNAVKAQKLPGVASPLRSQASSRCWPRAAASPASSARRGLKCPIYADHAALAMADFVCGANEGLCTAAV
jgi:prolyl-tRNA synthetase